jgi:hypothetical protein
MAQQAESGEEAEALSVRAINDKGEAAALYQIRG